MVLKMRNEFMDTLYNDGYFAIVQKLREITAWGTTL